MKKVIDWVTIKFLIVGVINTLVGTCGDACGDVPVCSIQLFRAEVSGVPAGIMQQKNRAHS